MIINADAFINVIKLTPNLDNSTLRTIRITIKSLVLGCEGDFSRSVDTNGYLSSSRKWEEINSLNPSRLIRCCSRITLGCRPWLRLHFAGLKSYRFFADENHLMRGALRARISRDSSRRHSSFLLHFTNFMYIAIWLVSVLKCNDINEINLLGVHETAEGDEKLVEWRRAHQRQQTKCFP